MQDSFACGHPLGGTVGDLAATTMRVLMQERTVDEVGDRLETTVGMPRRPFVFTGCLRDFAHLIHVNE